MKDYTYLMEDHVFMLESMIYYLNKSFTKRFYNFWIRKYTARLKSETHVLYIRFNGSEFTYSIGLVCDNSLLLKNVVYEELVLYIKNYKRR